MLLGGRKVLVRVGATFVLLLTLGFSSSPLLGGASAATPAEAANPCALADALAQAGEVKPAKKAYVAVLRADPTSQCAAQGLEELNPPPKEEEPAVDNCKVGDAFRNAHREDDAAGAYKKALEDNPEATCAVNGLEETGPSNVTRAVEEVTGSIPALVTIIVLLALIPYGVLILCRWDRLKRRLIRFWVIGKRIKHVLRPQLAFTDFSDGAVDGSPGAPLTARVKERLSRMREEAIAKEHEYDLDFGTPRDEFAEQVSASKTLESALASAGEVSEQTKLAAALIKLATLLLPIRRFAVSGSLAPPATAAALTLTLEEEGRSAAATHIRGATQKDVKANDYMALADPAAVWVQFGVARWLAREKWNESEAQSQALLREGLDRYRDGDLPEARDAFEQAIVWDHGNWGAYASLAVAEARLGSSYDRSIERILSGLEAMRKDGTGSENA